MALTAHRYIGTGDTLASAYIGTGDLIRQESIAIQVLCSYLHFLGFPLLADVPQTDLPITERTCSNTFLLFCATDTCDFMGWRTSAPKYEGDTSVYERQVILNV